MNQPDVALTDYGLAIECAVFVYFLALRPTRPSRANWFIVFFASVAVAAAAGGTAHGFFPEDDSAGKSAFWLVTMLSIGLTALAGAQIAALIGFGKTVALWISRAATVIFFVYVALVVLVNSSFVVAIVDYLPAVFLLAYAFLVAYRRHKHRALFVGFLGLCITLIAAFIQQSGWALDPRYFNHNATYHLLQGIGLFMIFIAARDLCPGEKL